MAFDFGSAVGGLLSGIGGLFKSSSDQKINQQNIEMQRETNALNESLWREQFEEAKRQYFHTLKYNSEEAQKAFEREAEWNSPVNQMVLLRNAGINPFSVFGQNANVSAVHSSPASGANGNIPSSPQMIAPNLNWQNSSLAANLQLVDSVVNAIDKLSSSSLRKSQKREIETLLKGKLEQLIADTENKDAQAALIRLQTDFENTFGYLMRDKQLEKYGAEISNLYEDTALKISQGEYIDEQKLTEETKRLVNRASARMNNEQARIFKQQANTFMMRFNQDIKESNSRINLNRASAQNMAADTETINQIRPYISRINAANARIQENEAAFKDETFIADVQKSMDILQQNGIITQTMQKQLDLAIKENNWYVVKNIINMACDVANSAAQFMPKVSITNDSRLGYDRVRGHYEENRATTNRTKVGR